MKKYSLDSDLTEIISDLNNDCSKFHPSLREEKGGTPKVGRDELKKFIHALTIKSQLTPDLFLINLLFSSQNRGEKYHVDSHLYLNS